MTTIVLADDHHIVRQGIRALLERETDFFVVEEAETGAGVPSLVERLKPDVLVIDLMMPGLNGLGVARRVSSRSPDTRVIILSMHADESYVIEALATGASGYVLKDSQVVDLIQAIHVALEGGRYLSPPLSERAIDAYVQSTQGSRPDAYEGLTTREREIFHLVAEGRTSPDIAEYLSISSRTVEVHRANMMRKLGLRTQTDLIRYALKRGILPKDVEM